jgi:sugar lactone lactonase YvrE
MNEFCRLPIPRVKLPRLLVLPFAVIAAVVTLEAQSNFATPYVFTTLAGLAGSYGHVDGTGSTARFYDTNGLAVDSAGNVYVAEYTNCTIRKVTPAGVVTTLAGTALSIGHADGTGAAARFNGPDGVAVDSAGNVYVADSAAETIRKITPAGVVTTLAGTWASFGSTDGTGAAARFSNPKGIAVDSAGNVYVADTYNHTIRKITSAGVVTTLAGTAGTSGHADGTGPAATFYDPTGVAVDSAGTVYVADTNNNLIRKITPAGVVTTLAGSGPLSPGLDDGIGTAATFDYPNGLAVDAAGNIYVADFDCVRKITPGGMVTTVAGSPGVAGAADGAGSAATFWNAAGVAVDSLGNVYVADTDNDTIRKGARVVAGDLSGDGKPDLVWENTATGDHYLWLMSNTVFASSIYLGNIATAWHVAATGDFNADGKIDLVWENTATGDRYVWLMNGATFASSVYLGNVSTAWHIAATGDFNGDGKPDLVWENTATGDRYLWLMNGSTFNASVYLGNLAAAWHVVGTGDFNGDGHTDLLWENSATGDHYVWMMNGTAFVSSVFLGNVATAWHVAGVGDFNADGHADLIWENNSTGDRYIWLMNGTVFSSSVYLGNLATQWRVKD